MVIKKMAYFIRNLRWAVIIFMFIILAWQPVVNFAGVFQFFCLNLFRIGV